MYVCMYVLYKYITRDFRALKNKEAMEPIRFQWIISFFQGGKQVEVHSYIGQKTGLNRQSKTGFRGSDR